MPRLFVSEIRCLSTPLWQDKDALVHISEINLDAYNNVRLEVAVETKSMSKLSNWWKRTCWCASIGSSSSSAKPERDEKGEKSGRLTVHVIWGPRRRKFSNQRFQNKKNVWDGGIETIDISQIKSAAHYFEVLLKGYPGVKAPWLPTVSRILLWACGLDFLAHAQSV